MANRNSETRAYKMTNLNPKGEQLFGPEHTLSKFIQNVCSPYTEDGSTVTMSWLVGQVQKAKILRITHPQLLRSAISACIREGSVPSCVRDGDVFQSKRGPCGGIFDAGAYKEIYGEEDYKRLRAGKDAKRLAKAS